MWDSLHADPVTVALSDDWASNTDCTCPSDFHGTTRKVYTLSKLSVSFIAWYALSWNTSPIVHYTQNPQKLLRKFVANFERGNRQITSSGHLYHCLDSLRQGTTCMADDTPMPTTQQKHPIGESRSWYVGIGTRYLTGLVSQRDKLVTPRLTSINQ